VFDLGGVLERIDDFEDALGTKWLERLGLSRADFSAALAAIDPGSLSETGQMSEAEWTARCAACLRLPPEQQREFSADVWNWYCGELDQGLMAFAASLRPRARTAIISNSADGARREELGRYALDEIFDPIIYSHEVGMAKPDPAIFELACSLMAVAPAEMIFVDDVAGHIAAARGLGIHGVLHRGTPETMALVNSLMAA
jgi:putative hydrolase of the HAD superfamily